MIRRTALYLVTSLIAALSLAGENVEQQLRPFLNTHCVDCHGPDSHKRNLRLDQLAANFEQKDSAALWVKVLDKVSAGEMPPKSEKPPRDAERNAFTKALRAQLQDASLAAQRRDGRVLVRRLNRIEYETTLRDLLGGSFDVREMLPNDNIAAGFDNVSEVLDVSSVHLLRYQDAAEHALATVIPKNPQIPFKERRTGKQIADKGPLGKQFKDLIDTSVRIDGDTLILYVRPYDHLPILCAPVPFAGRYRVRASVYAVNTDGKPLPMRCRAQGQWDSGKNDIRVRDVPADKATVIEDVYELKSQQVVSFLGWSLPFVRDFTEKNKKIDLTQYKGPGLAIEWLEIEGPIESYPPDGYKRLFGDVPLKQKSVAKLEAEGKPVPPPPAKRNDHYWLYDPFIPATLKPREDAERLMRAFLPIAFRRPVDETLQKYYVQIVEKALGEKMPFGDAMLLGYKAALCSPHFLYLSEPIVNGAAGNLDDYAIASRLSYFFWASMPDAELLALAAKKELHKPENLRAQVERMLNDPKGHRFTENFAGQWLELRNINATSPDPQVYGEFDPFLFWSMPRETEMFFEEILRNDRSLTEFIASDWTFLNQRLAQHYGIPNVFGGELRKVSLPPECHRGGVLTQASILKVTADGTRTSPVLRGKWVLDKILGQPPAPPPPDIPTIQPDIRGTTTIRQQLDKHRNTETCAACHRYIDPPGFALESFDVIGGWREFYRGTRGTLVSLPNYPGRKTNRGLDVEKGGETPGGKKFKDIDEYRQILLDDKDQLARSLARKLIIAATGAEIQFADREVVEELVAKARAKNYGFRSLIHEVVQSRVFLNK